MITAAIVIAILLILAFLRFGVAAEFSAEGLSVSAKAGPLSIRVLPPKEKSEKQMRKAELKAERKAQKKKKKKAKAVKKPGGLKAFFEMLPAIKKTLGRLRRRLLIKKLTIHYVAAGEDPAKTALMFGAAWAVFGAITPVLENSFRIKRRDLSASADFVTGEQTIYVNAAVSLAVWEAVYIAIAILPVFMKKSTPTDRKEVKKDG